MLPATSVLPVRPVSPVSPLDRFHATDVLPALHFLIPANPVLPAIPDLPVLPAIPDLPVGVRHFEAQGQQPIQEVVRLTSSHEAASPSLWVAPVVAVAAVLVAPVVLAALVVLVAMFRANPPVQPVHPVRLLAPVLREVQVPPALPVQLS
ncbi:MAG TPA: hypothetical protein VNS88_14885 [Nitrospiraceae bacterium]|nr:hypothetical protein [Nitrospiraceae bacterium]